MTKGEMVLGVVAGIVAAVSIGAATVLLKRVKILTPSWESGKKWMENSWLAGLPSTNFKIVTTVVLYFLTFFAWAVAVLLGKQVEEMTFGLWLAFLAGLGGFALAQFSKQRATDYGAMDRQAAIERAKNSGQGTTVVSDNTTVTGSPVTAVDDAGASSAPPAKQPEG